LLLAEWDGAVDEMAVGVTKKICGFFFIQFNDNGNPITWVDHGRWNIFKRIVWNEEGAVLLEFLLYYVAMRLGAGRLCHHVNSERYIRGQ
jgi:hypothetical protein